MKTRRPIWIGVAAGTLLAAVGLAAPAAAGTPTELLPPTLDFDTASVTQGAPATFTFHNPPGSVVPARFLYQVNSGPDGGTVDATNGGQGEARIVFTRFTNVLTVESVGPDGAVSGVTRAVISAAPPPPAADQDLTGQGKPDLLTVGGTAGLTSGLWMAPGQTGWGGVGLPAVNIGINGVFPDLSPADFDGTQVITGKFFGSSFEDFLVYYPSGIRAGAGAVIRGTGNGTPLLPISGNEVGIGSISLSDFNGDVPIQLANAYNSANLNGLPDLFGIVGDLLAGYTLDYYPSIGAAGLYDAPVAVSVPTPTGGSDWQNWRIYSKLLPSGTALLLWNPTNGGLYLWEGVRFDFDSGALTFTQYTLSASWQPGSTPSALQLTDFNDDGVPDLWAVTSAGDVTAYLVSGLSATGPATLNAGPTQHLS